MSRMPIAAAAAYLAGEITVEHVKLLTRCVKGAPFESSKADEAMLVDLARQYDADVFKPLVTRWIERADPDGIAATRTAR